MTTREALEYAIDFLDPERTSATYEELFKAGIAAATIQKALDERLKRIEVQKRNNQVREGRDSQTPVTKWLGSLE